MRAAAPGGHRLCAVTVDHGLRPASAGEAASVAAQCAAWGIPHDRLVWQHGGDIQGNLMQAAREARYRVMADWARAKGVAQVLLGHTADDQAEGFLAGLSRGAGLQGLSGMAARRDIHGVTFLRPLLSVRRQALRDHLTAAGIDWIDDPSNDDDRFQRARLRKALAVLAPLGIDVPQIATSQGHLAQSRAALSAVLADWAATHVQTPHGLIEIDRAALQALHPDLRHHLLRAAIGWITRARHAPRGGEVQRFAGAILAGRGATLAGCRARVRAQSVRLMREPRAIRPGLTDVGPWDGRWHIDGALPDGCRISALAAEGLAQRPGWRKAAIPRDALIVSPALWRGQELLCAPLLDATPLCRARIDAEFRLFILSH